MVATEITPSKRDLMWSRGALERVLHCPVCGGAPRPGSFERRDNDGGMPDRWCMVCCASCNSLWLDPRPDPDSLSRAYSNYYTHDAEVEDIPVEGARGLGWRLIHGYLNGRFGMHREPASAIGHAIFLMIEPWRLKLDYYGRQLAQRRFPARGRLLDIGCGNGGFLLRARDMGWNVHGCDPDPKAVDTCRRLGLDVIVADAYSPAFEPASFDVVMASHVLEHVPDQPAFVQRLFSLLNPNGCLWLALPNPASHGLQIFGAAWHALHPPYHLCIPSQAVLAGWLNDAGFVEARFIRRGAHVRRVWRISQAIAQREGIRIPDSAALRWRRIFADSSATISARRAEETVVMARRPRASHAE